MHLQKLSLGAVILFFFMAPNLSGELPPLISREILFGNPEKTIPKLSPDAKTLAWIAPDKNNVLQVWVKPRQGGQEKIVTNDKKRGIRSYFWTPNSSILIYQQDLDGDENFHLYGVDLESGNVRDYTPFQGVRASVVDVNPNFKDQILVSMNVRDRRLFDVYRLNLNTGALDLDTQNPGDISSWIADSKLVVRGATVSTPDGGTEIRYRQQSNSEWISWVKVGPEEILRPVSFNKNGDSLILHSSLNSDTARVVERNLATGADRMIAQSDEVDAEQILMHPTEYQVQAVSFAPGRSHWKVIDESIKEDFEAIRKIHDGDFSIVNRDDADKTWLVAFNSDRGPVRFYAFDRAKKSAEFLFVLQPKLDGLKLASMKPVVIPARDGLKLNSYLTLPPGLEPKSLPMVLLVHGGPWARDGWGFGPTAQWFANRGYACLQVNYRGSTGYGKKFLNAGNKQWGLKMHDDLIDSVDWAVKEGFADPKKIAIFGGSYGGYAALAGLAFTPEKFACAVDIVGPSNLKTLLQSIPPYWKPQRAVFDVRMGNIDDPADAELIKKASPLFSAGKIKRPLLIGQGANDPRVKQPESEQIVEAIEKNGGAVVYVLYPDEGHGFARPENRLDFYSRAEAFLAKYLGGRSEPVSGEKMPGSTAIVKIVGPK